MKSYRYSNSNGTDVKWSTSLMLGEKAIMLQALDAFNRFEFLRAFRQFETFKSGDKKTITKDGEKVTVEWTADDKAMFEFQEKLMDEAEDGVDMVMFAWVAADNDLCPAAAKYDQSEKKAAYCDLLVQRGRLLTRQGVPATFEELVKAVYECDAIVFTDKVDKKTEDFEKGVVKTVKGKSLKVNASDLL